MHEHFLHVLEDFEVDIISSTTFPSGTFVCAGINGRK